MPRYTQVLTMLALLLECMTTHESLAAHPSRRCQPVGFNKIRCEIRKISDCAAIHDYPYARNLFCPASFLASRTMARALAKSLGARIPAQGAMYFYQTAPDPLSASDDPAQTTLACLDTPAPWADGKRLGAGLPLCQLVAYVTSPGPVHGPPYRQNGNPVPASLRNYPGYFSNLYAPDPSHPLIDFKSGSLPHDALVRTLGSAAYDGFLADYPGYSPTGLYDPDHWALDSRYRGITGGGGGGWGGEIAMAEGGAARVLLAFGGGGGGGMTSQRGFPANTAVSRIGAGGGGGMQIAKGYRHQGKRYSGLGLGAGHSHEEAWVQYSYYDNDDVQSATHDYSWPIIKKYKRHLGNAKRQLRAHYLQGRTILLKGGGGMGAGAAYLMPNGEEYTPHALSTQAGFQFSYAFRRFPKIGGSETRTPASSSLLPPTAAGNGEQNLYTALGEFYRQAHQQAYAECGKDYSNFSCICPKAQAMVICLAGQVFDRDAEKIPGWLQQAHCPDEPASLALAGLPSAPVKGGLSPYQGLLYASMSGINSTDAKLDAQDCQTLLLEFFKVQR